MKREFKTSSEFSPPRTAGQEPPLAREEVVHVEMTTTLAGSTRVVSGHERPNASHRRWRVQSKRNAVKASRCSVEQQKRNNNHNRRQQQQQQQQLGEAIHSSSSSNYHRRQLIAKNRRHIQRLSAVAPQHEFRASTETSTDFEAQERQILFLVPYRERLLLEPTLEGKIDIVDASETVQAFINSKTDLVEKVMPSLSKTEQYLIKVTVLCGQQHVFSRFAAQNPESEASLSKLLTTLGKVEVFYDMIGGIVGYQTVALELMHESFGGPPAAIHADKDCHGLDCVPSYEDNDEDKNVSKSCDDSECDMSLHVPSGPDLREGDGEFARKAARKGIEALPEMCEIYPLGGAGDRLGLLDPENGEALPAAFLPYNGRPLLEGLIRDVRAREWLYYKIKASSPDVFDDEEIEKASKLVTPIAIMTSMAKGNHRRISKFMNDSNWFGRGRDNFRLFEQPLVPVLTTRGGEWISASSSEDKGENYSCEIALKPGGHGALWKLMYDEGVFDWLEQQKRTGGVVRQITNPMAGTDTTLLALSGLGRQDNKALGFVSCERAVGASEGINVLVEKTNQVTKERWYGISNVEYTELDKLGISDEPAENSGAEESAYPANTNVLYVGLKHIRDTLTSSPRAAFPGMLINLSKAVKKDGTKGGRLECSMQNIADALMRKSPGKLTKKDWMNLPTFVLFTLRRRVTSSAKRQRKPDDKSLAQTPDGSFLDLLLNASDMLSKCSIEHPPPDDGSAERYLNTGPGFIFAIHPAMGPLWDIIAQKLRGGSIARKSEVKLEIAELNWENVRVAGSLLITCTNVTGEGTMSDIDCGRARIVDVDVLNAGIDWENEGNVYWSAMYSRDESAEIVLHGNAEIDIEGCALRGNCAYEVPNGKRLVIRSVNGDAGCLSETYEDIVPGVPSWRWKYAFGGKDDIQSDLVKLHL